MADAQAAKKRSFITVPWSAREAVVVFALSWVGLPVLAVLVLRQLAPVLPLVHDFLQSLANGDLTATFIFDLFDAAASVGLVCWRLRRHGVGLAAVGLRRFKPLRALGYLVAIYLLFILAIAGLYALVSLLFPAFNANQAQVNAFTTTVSTAPSVSFIALVLIPPFMEEIVFRGYLFPAFAQRFGTIAGAIVTSLFFGLAHLQLNISLYTFMLSLLLCFLYVRLRSIWPGIAFHMINNFLAFVALGTAK